MSNKKQNELCKCQSGKAFQQCCDRFLNQQQFAETTVELMRSRYSAFALGGYGEYLLSTWKLSELSNMTEELNAAKLSVCVTKWVNLDIIDESHQDDQGIVEFKAYYLDAKGVKSIHHERSVFERIQGRWLYVKGDVTSS